MRFGADRVFKADESVTDQDIDVIIGRGQHKTATVSKKLMVRMLSCVGVFPVCRIVVCAVFECFGVRV